MSTTISPIADIRAGVPGYTIVITDPTFFLTTAKLLHQINASIRPIVPKVSVTHTTTAEGIPKWHIFIPESVIAPDACYAHSPIDEFCRNLSLVAAAAFSDRSHSAKTEVCQSGYVPAYTVTESGQRRSTRIAAKTKVWLPGFGKQLCCEAQRDRSLSAKYNPPLATATGTGGGCAPPTPPIPALPSYAPAGVTDPDGCFFITQKGAQCKRKRAPYDCVCGQHAVLGNRPKDAPLPCPPGHILHPEPAHIPDDIVTAILSDLETATSEVSIEKNLTQEMVTKILASMNTILSINPTITHPIVFENSHPSHKHIHTLHGHAQRIHDCYIGSKIFQQNFSVQFLVANIRALKRLLPRFL